jgi:hypothetical protein
MREAEPALRDIQLRRGDAEIEKDAGKSVAAEPGPGDFSEVLETGVASCETWVVPETLSSVSQRLRVFVQSE